MKRKAILVLLCLSFAVGGWAQKVRKMADVDSLVGVVYAGYQKQWSELSQQYQQSTDSVRQVAIAKQYNQSQAKCNAEVLALYAKYPKLEGAAERYFRLRGALDKKEMAKWYGKLPAPVRAADPYAVGLRSYLDARQVSVGDTVGTFRATMPRGVAFRFGDLVELKDVLLIFGDWHAMGRDMQLMVQVMYRKVDLSKLELVSVVPSTDQALFEQQVRAAQVPWVAVSDFKGELSPLYVAFGVHTTPMCVYVSKGGRVEEVALGVTDSILARIQDKSYGVSVEVKQ